MRLDALLPEILDHAADFAMRQAEGLTADSRAVLPGYVFFAVPGTKSDGLAYAEQAAAHGALAIVAERRPETRVRGVAYVVVPNVRLALAEAAARFYAYQPDTIVAVTGTSGKTSVADFTRQIFAHLGRQAASLGTIGIVKADGSVYGSLTTPDPVTLHAALADLAREGVTHLAVEASSHGLDQHRLDGVRLRAAAFTNLSRDHLDYHASLDEYLDAKLRLFRTLLPDGAPAVIDADSEVAGKVIAACTERGLKVMTVGAKGESVTLEGAERSGFATNLNLAHDGQTYAITLPLLGSFQISNALVTAGLCIASGEEPAAVFAALEHLRGAPGRLELVGSRYSAPVFVDYSHKPDALEKVLQVLRPLAERRLIVVFGCGGDRDKGKRPIMGRIATQNADVVIVTDDNPRSEDPATIRAEILSSAPGAIEMGDRSEAIAHGIRMLAPGDVLVIAGKGHESGQIVGDLVLPFSDQDVAKQILENLKGLDKPPVWSGLGLVAPLKARVSGGMPAQVSGVSIDTRTLEQGDLFVALKGDAGDGHDYVAAAFEKGAAAAVVDEDHADKVKGHGPLYIVRDVLPALERLGRAARERSRARIIAVTGSVGKTTTKEALREVLSSFAPTHASIASYNNHWGVPLTLARMPANTRFGVFEIGMNHADEITPLVDMVRPHVAIITTVAPVHLEFFPSVEAIAEAKAEIFSGIAKGGLAIIPRDIAQFELLREKAKASPAGHVISFGEHEDAHARLLSCTIRDDGTLVEASILGQHITYLIGAPGKHMAMNSLAVLVAARAVGADMKAAAQMLARFTPASGRGARVTLHVPEGEAILIDESYNANPTSMRAALALLSQSRPHGQGRRIAVIGDMLELGDNGPELHRGLADDLQANSVDLLFGAGPLTQHLFEAVPEYMRGRWAERSADIEEVLRNTVRAGDIIMVKGSKGSRMTPLVAALKTHFANTPTDQN